MMCDDNHDTSLDATPNPEVDDVGRQRANAFASISASLRQTFAESLSEPLPRAIADLLLKLE
jgi:hypothetical protein